jgi:hypothetical protein
MADGLHYDGGGDDSEGGDDYMSLAKEAFPDDDWTPERVSALKTLVKLCAGGGDEPDADDGDDAKKPGLALIFGGPPKKK